MDRALLACEGPFPPHHDQKSVTRSILHPGLTWHMAKYGSQIPCDGHDTRSMFSLVHDRCETRLREHSTVPLVRPISNDLDAMSDYTAHSIQ
jgi:hypothetical protein